MNDACETCGLSVERCPGGISSHPDPDDAEFCRLTREAQQPPETARDRLVRAAAVHLGNAVNAVIDALDPEASR